MENTDCCCCHCYFPWWDHLRPAGSQVQRQNKYRSIGFEASLVPSSLPLGLPGPCISELCSLPAVSADREYLQLRSHGTSLSLALPTCRAGLSKCSCGQLQEAQCLKEKVRHFESILQFLLRSSRDKFIPALGEIQHLTASAELKRTVWKHFLNTLQLYSSWFYLELWDFWQ